MKAVLYICHGSRVKAGQTAALDFIEKTMLKVDAPIQEACFLELAEPSIEQGITRCIEQGATEIIAVPVLLLHAGHAKFDIPYALEQAIAPYPGIPLYYGEPFGVHPHLVDVLVERMQETAGAIPDDASILIVGRGSSDPVVHDYFAEIIRLFKERTGLSQVEAGFLAACGPSFEDALNGMIKREAKHIFILPYLLFTGILMKSMERTVGQLATDSTVSLCPPLGYDPLICEIIRQRVEEATWKGVDLNVSDHGRRVV